MSKLNPTENLANLLMLSQTGDATAAQIDELNELLRSSVELRVVASDFLQLESMLADEYQARHAAESFSSQSLPRNHPITFGDSDLEHSTDRKFQPWIFVIAASIIGAAIIGSAFIRENVRVASNLGDQQVPLSSVTGQKVEKQNGDKSNQAAISFEMNAVWQPAHQLGDNIVDGNLSLLSGIGRLHTTRGAELIMDARLAPVHLNISPDSSIFVEGGTVYVTAHEESLGFSIRTPTTSIVDIGTRFGVSVNNSGHSEVSVIDGAVSCMPLDRAPKRNHSMLGAGQATIFKDSMDQQGARSTGSTANAAYDDLIQLIKKTENKNETGTLLAYDGFDHPIGQAPKKSAGTGWNGNWYSHTAPLSAPVGVIRTGQYLTPPAWLAIDNRSYFVQSLESATPRKMETPISLSDDGDYFISFLIRKQLVGTEHREGSAAGVSLLRSTGENKLAFFMSIDMRQKLILFTGEERFSGFKQMEDSLMYFVILKLQLRKSGPDNIFAKACTLSDPPQVSEPQQWDTVGIPASLDGTIDTLHLWSNGSAVTAIDEIRVGTTWRSVVPLRN